MSPPEARRSPRRRPGRKRPLRRQGLALKRRGDAPATATSRKRQRRRTVLQRNRSADCPAPVQIALRPGLGAGQTASAQASEARVLAEVPAPIQPCTGRRFATANRCGSATRSRSAARTTRAGADPLGSNRLTSCLAHRRHRHRACRDLVRAPGRAAGGAGGRRLWCVALCVAWGRAFPRHPGAGMPLSAPPPIPARRPFALAGEEVAPA